MKKTLILTVCAVVMAVFSANAQDTSFGVRAGLNVANLSGDDVEDLDSRLGIHIGAYAQFPVSDMVVIEPNLLFSTEGASISEEFMGISYDETIALTYLDIPVLARFYVSEGFNVFVGPSFGLNLGGKYKVEVDGESEEEDIEDLNGLTLGLNAGIGYQLESGLNFQAGYDLGLSSIMKEVEGESVDAKNSVIQVSVGYNF